MVVAQLSQPIQKLLKGDLLWQATEVPGTEVAEVEYQSMHWPHPRRLVLIRHELREPEDTRAGKRLLDVPGYRFQALVTSLSAATHRPLAVWRYYNGRADCENVIKELREGFALPTLCLENVRERAWWRRLWEKILSPLPNCNAVENRPAFTP